MKYPQLVSMPSEISDWLEEQLEARGIDSVVYTRYILSLLHRDPIDLVCPDQDLSFAQPNKEVRRSGSGRKRFRCLSEWRDHAQADAEQLKRSAAIECLMSASDQNCGIESLVDELCEKLKEVNKDALANTKPASSNSSALQNISPQDLARQYYAAFPPLTQHRTPPSIVSLLPKWFSPKKKGRKSRSASFDDKLHKIDDMKARAGNKQRYFSRSRNDLGYSRSMAKSVERSESMTDWDLFMFTNNAKNKQGGAIGNSDAFDQIAEEKASMDNIEPEPRENKIEWSDEDSMNICDDLPVDILDLLDSPSPQNYTVAMMNLANMRDAGNKNFIHYGTNITSSIWSIDAFDDSTMFDNNYNAALDTDQSETLLGIKFKSLTVGNKSIESIWSNQDIVENETNMIYENFGKSSLANPGNVFGNNLSTWSTSGMEKLEKWSDGSGFDTEQYLRLVALSLLKLNHNKEESSFIETIPGIASNTETQTQTQSQTPANTGNSFFTEACDVVKLLSDSGIEKASVEKVEENLLTSTRSHFRPINAFAVSTTTENKSSKKYQDGASFVISGSLDRPNYKRSESGSQYLESVFGSPKKLLEYKGKNSKSQNAFVLKFFVCQNDKACQTENSANDSDGEMDNSQEVPCKKRVMSQPEEFFFPGDEELLEDEKQCRCSANNETALNPDLSYGDDTACYVHAIRPDSMLAEMWKSEPKRCDKCSNGSSWSSNWTKMGSNESIWQLNKESLQSIWNGGEVCSACLGINGGRPPLSAQQSQLREDISQDGEQLLSDLSTLQKSYMEQLPAAEISYDISELIVGTKERKRRHSPVLEMTKNAVPVHRGSWSIASQVKQDRFMQVASVPVLHSVTL